MRRHFLAAVALAVSALAGVVRADVVFDRGLPAADLNDSAGVDRSNVSWGNKAGYFTGDDFILGGTGQYLIESLTVWTPINRVGTSDTIEKYNPHGIQLYFGEKGVSEIADSGVITGNAGSNPDVVFAQVTYPDAAKTNYYLGQGGVKWQLWAVTFKNLNLVIDANTLYQFGINSPDGYWYNHASNAGRSGSTQDGADGFYRDFALSTLAAGGLRTDSTGNGWDKSSDINVRLTGEAIPPVGGVAAPLPGTAWAGLGLLMLAGIGQVVRRRRGRTA